MGVACAGGEAGAWPTPGPQRAFSAGDVAIWGHLLCRALQRGSLLILRAITFQKGK